MNEKIDQHTYQNVLDTLKGLENVLDNYKYETLNGDNAAIEQQWTITKNLFDFSCPTFQSNGSQVLLLPLFGQFATLNLALLRDGVIFGESWGWGANKQQQIAQELTATIKDFVNYAEQAFQAGYNPLANSGFTKPNRYVRHMTLTVLDFKVMWPYFDASIYDTPVVIYIDREIYSDPVGIPSGTSIDDNPGLLVKAAEPITKIDLFGFPAGMGICGLTLHYPPFGGPNGQDILNQGMVSKSNPLGSINLIDNPVISINVGFKPEAILFGTVTSIDLLTFTLNSGGKQSLSYGVTKVNEFVWFEDELVTSITFLGAQTPVWPNNICFASQIIFGFKYQTDQNINAETLAHLYTTHPASLTVDEFLELFPKEKLPDPGSTEDWPLRREAYWNHVKLTREHRQDS